MFEKIVICITNQKLTVGVWRLGKLHSHCEFVGDEAGQRDFGHYLDRHANTPVYVLVDASEEDFRLETLPHSSGSARRELVERKLNQIYRGLPFRAAEFINRERDKRKDDRFLFVALNNADLTQAWMRIMESKQTPLVGVYLLAMVSQVIIRRMKLMAPHLILTERLGSGLRQSYLHNGRLRISRLAPNLPADKNKMGYFCLVETEKTRLYLVSQRFIQRDTKLAMVLPSLTNESEQICRDIEQEYGIDCINVDLAGFAKGQGLAPQLLQSNPELLHMHLLARGHVPKSLAPANLIKHYQLDFIRRSLNLATLVVLLAGLFMTASYLYQNSRLTAATELAASDTRIEEARYAEVAKDFPVTPIASHELQQAVELHKIIQTYSKPPRRLMQVLSQALDSMPEMEIDRLRWVLSSDINIKDEDKAQNTPLSSGANVPPGFIPTPGMLYEIGFVDGGIKGFGGDYRAALVSVKQLSERLKAHPAVAEVAVLQEPVNVSSYASLQGSTADERVTLQEAARFKIKLILKPAERAI